MTNYEFGDVVLVSFPFTDQSATKKRPAVVISSALYHQQRPDLVLMAITSRIRTEQKSVEHLILEWQKTGLLKPSVIKPVFTTIEKTLILNKLGQFGKKDKEKTSQLIQILLGP